MVSKRQAVIFIIVILITLTLTDAIYADFSPKIEKFILEGKKVRVSVQGKGRDIILTPLEEIEISGLDKNKRVQLVKEEDYSITLSNLTTTERVIQVFATFDNFKAEQVKYELIDRGYRDVRVVQTGQWFKVQIGPLTSRNEAEKIMLDLKKNGWETWLLHEVNTEKKIVVFNNLNKPVFSDNYILIKGKVKVDGEIYSGLLEFIRKDDTIDMYNTVDLSTLISGILASEFSFAAEKENLPVIKARAVALRTNILYKLFNSIKPLYFDEYKGIGNVNWIVREGVRATSGQILTYYGDLIELDFPLEFAFSKLGKVLDYDGILKEYYDQFFSQGVKLQDLSKIIQEKMLVEADIRLGLKYKEIRQLTWWGPRVITILDLNLKRPGFVIEPVLAGGIIPGLDDLNDLVIKEDALAGINGGFFHYSGRPLGLFMKSGTIISEPIKNRTSFGLTKDGKVVIEPVTWKGIIKNSNGTKKAVINGVNRKPGNNEIVLINKYYGTRAPELKDGILELVVSRGKIRQINNGSKQRTIIPDSGFILQVHGRALSKVKIFEIGDEIEFSHDFTPDWENYDIVTALGAGPTLLKDGEIHITASKEEFQPDITVGRAPRSALGITSDNHLVFFTVDGRQPDLSIGITLQELAKFMLNYGIIDGMNLDGGGSARMVVRGLTMNNPSDKRLISNAILIKFARK